MAACAPGANRRKLRRIGEAKGTMCSTWTSPGRYATCVYISDVSTISPTAHTLRGNVSDHQRDRQYGLLLKIDFFRDVVDHRRS